MEAWDIFAEIQEELKRATLIHGSPFRSAHEGWAIIREEVDELWDEVKSDYRMITKMRREAIHVAAMALRFIQDVCDG